MDVEIVLFPMTQLAVIEHYGASELEHESVNKLIKWRQENQLLDNKYRNYGIHYTNPNQRRRNYIMSIWVSLLMNLLLLTFME